MNKKIKSLSLSIAVLVFLCGLAVGAQAATAPIIASTTHPDNSIYYSNNDPSFNWTYTGDAEIKGYSVLLDQIETSEPDTSAFENIVEKNYTDIPDGTWYVHVKAVDINDTWSDTAHYQVKIDTTAPTGTVLINGGADSTDNTTVNLAFDVQDELSGVSEMRFAESLAALAGEPYKTFASSDTLVLSDSDGVKTVYAQFKDAAGNESAVVSDTIILAPTPYSGKPRLSISIDKKWYAPGEPVVISGKLKDYAGNGLARYIIKIKARGKIIGTAITQVGGGYSFEAFPKKTTPYKAVFIRKNGNKLNTRAVVAHVKKPKKNKGRD